MSDHKFTPGPWVAVRNASYWDVKPQERRWEDPFTVGDVCASAPGYPDAGLQEANARLIAAAPEMIDVLLQWRNAEATSDDAELRCARFARDHAIAKALGE